MKGNSPYLERMLRRVGGGLNLAGAALLFILMLLTTADVSLRYLLNRPIQGVFEISELMMAGIVFLGVAHATAENAHAKVDILFRRFSLRAQAAAEIFTSSVVLGLLGLIIWRGAIYAKLAVSSGEVAGAIPVPGFLFKFLVPLGFLFVFLWVLLVLIRSLVKLVRRR